MDVMCHFTIGNFYVYIFIFIYISLHRATGLLHRAAGLAKNQNMFLELLGGESFKLKFLKLGGL